MTYRKFTSQERKHAQTVIRDFLKNNGGLRKRAAHQALITHLNTLVEHPNGEWTSQKLSSFLTNFPVRVRRASTEIAEVSKPQGDRITVAEIVLASNMAPPDKERVLKSLFSS